MEERWEPSESGSEDGSATPSSDHGGWDLSGAAPWGSSPDESELDGGAAGSDSPTTAPQWTGGAEGDDSEDRNEEWGRNEGDEAEWEIKEEAGLDQAIPRAPSVPPPPVRMQQQAVEMHGGAAAAAPPAAKRRRRERARTSTGDLSFEQCWALLSDPAQMCDGPRPDHLQAEVGGVEAQRGRLFKELHHSEDGGRTRTRGTDKWQKKHGSRGHTDLKEGGQLRRGPKGAFVRRYYGSLKPVGVDDQPAASPINFHEYEIRSADGAAVEGRHRVWHLLPNRRKETVQVGLVRVQHEDDAAKTWMQFEDASAAVKGSIEQNPSGWAFLSTPAGDFAEYHRRMPRDEPFQVSNPHPQ